METTIKTDVQANAYLNRAFEEAVPPVGPADSMYGELTRAITRIDYRYYNDGDMLGTGYGRETCNPAGRFLFKNGSEEMGKAINELWGTEDDARYKQLLENAEFLTANYLKENREKLMAESGGNMMDWWDASSLSLAHHDTDEYCYQIACKQGYFLPKKADYRTATERADDRPATGREETACPHYQYVTDRLGTLMKICCSKKVSGFADEGFADEKNRCIDMTVNEKKGTIQFYPHGQGAEFATGKITFAEIGECDSHEELNRLALEKFRQAIRAYDPKKASFEEDGKATKAFFEKTDEKLKRKFQKYGLEQKTGLTDAPVKKNTPKKGHEQGFDME